MKLLVDTQLLIWLGQGSRRLPHRAATLLADMDNLLVFSSLSVAEVAIKFALGRSNFTISPRDFRVTLLANDFAELPLLGEHTCRLADLPNVHKDPFDRLLVAQALAEGMTFLSADAVLGGYPGQIIIV